jgi:riboflavin kinase
LKSFYVKGRVISGKGEGANFLRLRWVRKQIKEKLGFTPHLGTLNIKLNEEHSNTKDLLKQTKGMLIMPTSGFRRGRCFRAYLMDFVECAIVIPEVEDYPEDLMEIVAPVNLREKLELKDGDTIEVEILLG